MKIKGLLLGILTLLALTLAGCGSASTGKDQADPVTPAPEQPPAEKTIVYLDKSYTVPGKVERIVITGSMEAMEDALVLDVSPVGAITFAGQFPEIFAPITANAESIGEKTQPNFETILKLDPDVILATTKFSAEVMEQLEKIAPSIQVSHIAENWEANLKLLGELTGKQELAEQKISQYHDTLNKSKAELLKNLEGKKVLAVRVRKGAVNIYPESIFVNPVLYGDLGLEVPAEVTAAKSQQTISIEQFAQINPDYLFIQFSESENADTPNAMQDLENNPIVKNMTAFKDGHVFVNVIDPLCEGGPAGSRISFLEAVLDKLGQ